MLSFDKGEPIARIEGGLHHGKIIKIYDADKEKMNTPDIKLSDLDVFDILSVDYFKGKKKKITLDELEELKKSLQKNIEPLNKQLTALYKDAKDEIKNKLIKEFELIDEGHLVPLPRNEKEQRDNIYVSGSSGSGKSTWTANYLKEFVKLFPDKRIFLFSRVSEDKPLDAIGKVTRIIIDEDLIDDPIDINELNNSCCVFDDIDTIPNKDLKNAIIDLRKDILETGRHEKIYCISTSHMLTNYKETRELLNEANKVIFFPKSSGTRQIKYFLQNYGGMTTADINKVFDLPSRWVMLSKNYPQYILCEKSIYLLSK